MQSALAASIDQDKEVAINTQQNTLLASALATAISLLVGCAGTPNAKPVQLPEPKDVPQEKWSDAMHVLTAMKISGQRDIPKELAGDAAGIVAQGASGPVAADAVMTGLNVASPPTGFSSGGALGLGLGLMLLGGSSNPVNGVQVVAWVPEELAASPEAASALVLQRLEEARLKVFNKRSKVLMKTGKYPGGSSLSYRTLSDVLADRPVPFNDPATPPPYFINAKRAYGPIFVRHNQFLLDASKNDMPLAEGMIRASNYLPEWMYIYNPGERLRKKIYPAAIYNQNQALFFIGK